MQQSKLTLIGISLFVIGIVLLIISILSMEDLDLIPRTTLAMNSFGFGILFLLIGLGLLLLNAIEKLK